ncbi:unnamed protein product [Ambrosiozyma monospora]|uniref:Unnamed protein product n=1 Tax=Ambrosiozyma monospora TaxID=43982 RepID=A0A9W6Z373_AMBMO|nr:unnamed protein product [Ambrosiozyma monospora]
MSKNVFFIQSITSPKLTESFCFHKWANYMLTDLKYQLVLDYQLLSTNQQALTHPSVLVKIIQASPDSSQPTILKEYISSMRLPGSITTTTQAVIAARRIIQKIKALDDEHHPDKAYQCIGLLVLDLITQGFHNNKTRELLQVDLNEQFGDHGVIDWAELEKQSKKTLPAGR